MARPTWSGSISFGLVNIPIKLHTATESRRVAFHELEEGTGQRIRYKRVAEKSGREVPWKKIQKGFEVSKGRFVVLTDEEMAAAAPAKTRTIEIEQFVQLDEIDPVSWDHTYYVVPDGPQAAKAFALLRRAMEARKRVAIGRFVMRTKEYLACVRPYGNLLALETMFFPDEVRDTDAIAEDVRGRAAVSDRELTMAGQLIDSLTSPWKPEKFHDTFRDHVMKVVAKKAKGQEIAVTEDEPEEKGQVIDLMAALKQTLEGQRRGGGRSARASKPARASARSGAVRRPAAATTTAATGRGARSSGRQTGRSRPASRRKRGS